MTVPGPAIDRAVLAELSAGEPEFEREIVQRYQKHNLEDAAMLLAAVAERDFAQARHAAHRIKGASRTVGANALAAVSAEIEDATRVEDWAAIDSRMDAFRRELARLAEYIVAEHAAPLAP
jgi:two-component system, NarL family, sensor histidine kinase EvgS